MASEAGRSGSAPDVLTEAILSVARDLTASVPAPRGAPFFCLDAGRRYDLRCLETLAERGIFRKYELVLLTHCGLGGEARWLATRLGCRVLGVAEDVATVAAAVRLNERARMQNQVRFQVGEGSRLPLRNRIFTHVWMLDESISGSAPAVYAEVFRVLRPGGSLLLHLEAADHEQTEPLRTLLQAAGFTDVQHRQTPVVEQGHACAVARDRLQVQMRRQGWVLPVEGDSCAEVFSCAQVFARRPS